MMVERMNHWTPTLEDRRARITGRSLLWNNLLSEPLFTLYGFLTFILYKGLHATPFQITILTMLKPLVTILSFYWSAGLKGRSKKLKSNVIWAGVWMRIPFLCSPWIESPWFLIGAVVNYMFFYRAGIPAWLEILRRNLGTSQGKSFSWASAMGYGEGILLSLGIGALLDQDPNLWKILIVFSSLIGLIAVFIQSRVPLEHQEAKTDATVLSFKDLVLRPWRDSLELMKKRKDFARFQMGFMICGFGIMMIQPILPLFMVDHLQVSYLEMATAFSIMRGLGVSLSSPIWGKYLDQVPLLKISGWVFFFFGFFPILLSFASWGVFWLYIAYFWYGVAQGGCHLVWNLSGPLFSKEDDSSRYSGVNVVMAGLRGAVAPPTGGWMATFLGPIWVLFLGGFFCFYGGWCLVQRQPDPQKIS